MVHPRIGRVKRGERTNRSGSSVELCRRASPDGLGNKPWDIGFPLQAVGRVIRSETDRGVGLLIDERFSRWPYRELLPKWWNVKSVSRANPV